MHLRIFSRVILPSLAAALLFGCAPSKGTGMFRGSDDDDTAYLDPEDPEAPSLVLMITVDALNRDFMGRRHEGWNVTPSMDALIGESTSFENVMTVRGLTSVALGSLHTGAYPKNTGLRSHTELVPSDLPHLAERFSEAGWTTLGFSGNQCQYIDRGFHQSWCSQYDGNTGIEDQAEGDAWLASEFSAALEGLASGERVFAWIHFMDPHDPYVPTNHLTEFYPYVYTGDLEVWSYEDLSNMVLDGEAPSPTDKAYIDAVYASQVRGVDDHVGFLLDTLKARGLYDRAAIALGIDHGEELYGHNAYPYHGCSLYQDVLATAWSIRSPAQDEGRVVSSWTSLTDIAPTLTELAGVPWTGLVDGVSLVPVLRGGQAEERPVYFERDPETAGMVLDGHKVFLTVEPQYQSCEPYVGAGRGSYDTPQQALFDLVHDPMEATNLSSSNPDLHSSMVDDLCAWITEDGWLNEGDDSRSPLVQLCEK